MDSRVAAVVGFAVACGAAGLGGWAHVLSARQASLLLALRQENVALR